MRAARALARMLSIGITMKPSRFNRQISVLRKSTSKDARGGEVVEWVPLVALPGSPLLPERWWAEVQDVLPSRAEKEKVPWPWVRV